MLEQVFYSLAIVYLIISFLVMAVMGVLLINFYLRVKRFKKKVKQFKTYLPIFNMATAAVSSIFSAKKRSRR